MLNYDLCCVPEYALNMYTRGLGRDEPEIRVDALDSLFILSFLQGSRYICKYIGGGVGGQYHEI